MSVFSYAGTGNITSHRFLFLGESVSYSYIPAIEDIFVRIDLGPLLLSTPTVSIDHGSVTQQQSYAREDWGYIRFEQSRYAFGDIKLASSTTFVVKKHYVGSGQIFEFGKSQTRLVAPWLVSGTVRVSGIGQTRFVPNFNANGIVNFKSFTNISRSVQHFGAGKIFSTSLSSTTQSRVFNASGLFHVHGASKLGRTRSYHGEGTLPTLSTTITNKTFSYSGSGFILSLSSKIENRVYSYNGSSIFDFNYADYGSVSQSASSFIQYSDIDVITSVKEDWGLIKDTFTRYPFGTKRISGVSASSFLPSWVGSGTIAVSGRAIIKQKPLWIGYGVIDITGLSVPNFSLLHPGSGSLFSIGGGDERSTYAYRGSGKLFTRISSGEANTEAYVGSGAINVSSSADFSFTPNWVGGGTIEVGGGVGDVLITHCESGFGRLFNISSKEERRTYSYNSSSIEFFEYLDYGLVAQNYTSNSDNGLVTEPSTGGDDWGLIRDTSTNYPFGGIRFVSQSRDVLSRSAESSGSIKVFGASKLFVLPRHNGEGVLKVSGNAHESNTETYVGDSQINIFGESVSSNTDVYLGSGNLFTTAGAAEVFGANPPENVSLFKLSGVANYAFRPNWVGSGYVNIVPDIVYVTATSSYKGTGNLFNISSKEERRTYSYNGSSIDYFEYLDYGLVSQSAVQSEDSGYIVDNNDGRTDWGLIRDTITNYPFGGLRFVSLTKPNFSIGHTTSGYLPVFAGAAESFAIPAIIKESTILVSGSAHSAITNNYLGQGSLFNIQSADISRSRQYYGSGTIFAINGVAESFGANPPEQILPINLNGSASTSFTPNWNSFGTIRVESEQAYVITTNAYSGFGRLFEISSKEERRTYSYNTSSVVEYAHLDYGLVSNNHTTSYDYEGILNNPSITDDYEYIIPNITRYPFGDFNVFGASKTNFSLLQIGGGVIGPITGEIIVRFPPFHAGEGVLFGLGGSAESASVSYPSDTNIFKITGSATELVGFASASTLKISIFGEGQETIRNASERFVIIDIFGSAKETHTESYIGSGRIFAFAGAAEAVGFDEDIIAANIKISGTGTERTSAFVPVQGGILFGIGGASESSTTAETKLANIILSGEAKTRRIPNFNGSGSIKSLSGAAIAAAYSPDEEQVLINLKGFARQTFTSRNIGTGALQIFGEDSTSILTFVEKPTVEIDIFGEAKTNRVPNFNGSGSIKSLSGAAIAAAYSPDEEQVLLAFSGVARQTFTSTNIGDASLRILGEDATPILTFAEQSTVRIFVSGQAGERFVPNWNGFGTLFAFDGAAESFGVNPPDQTTDLKFSGFASESFSYGNYDGLSDIKLFGEIEIPIRTFAEQPTVEIDIFGTVIESNTESYAGSGSIFAISGAAESVGYVIPEITTDIKLSGDLVESVGFREVGSGFITNISGTTSPEILTFAEQPIVEINVFGVGKTNFSLLHIGSGSIFSVGGAAEATSVNPPDITTDIQISGSRESERISRSEIGSGFTTVYGNVFDVRFIPNFNGSGTIYIDTTTSYSETDTYIGSGSIFAVEGAAESLTVNPDERQILFSFVGKAQERIANSEVKTVELDITGEVSNVHIVRFERGDGFIKASGIGKTNFSLRHIGSGFISNLSGAAESVSYNPLEEQLLFSFKGFVVERHTESYFGKGILYGVSGASESTAVVPETQVSTSEAQNLFRFAGNDVDSTSKAYVGRGNLFSIGNAIDRETFAHESVGTISISGSANYVEVDNYVGSGVISTISGAAEVVSTAESFITNIKISGSAATFVVTPYKGSGVIFSIGGTAESASVSYPTGGLFKIGGLAKSSKTKTHLGEITTTLQGSAGVAFIRIPYIGSGNIDISGEAQLKESNVYVGAGSIRKQSKSEQPIVGLSHIGNGAIEIYGESKNNASVIYRGSGRVFNFGRVKEVSPPEKYIGFGVLVLNGQSIDRRVHASPERTYGWIV